MLAPTIQQDQIFTLARETSDDLLIEALAGSGKTTTILESLKSIRQQTILLTAFNKRIADTLEAKLQAISVGNRVVHVKTFHALGNSILRKAFPRLTTDKNASENLVNSVEGKHPFKIRRAAVKLLRIVKEQIMIKQPLIDEMIELGYVYDVFITRDTALEEAEIEQVADLTYEAYVRGINFSKRTEIDFCDMIWGPLVNDLPLPSRYQAVIIDEMQDISSPQFALVKRAVAPQGRLIGVGDRNQAIYKWRGAIPDEVWATFGARAAKTMKLTTCFRCPTRVIAEAQTLVPEIQARDDAPEGFVEHISVRESFEMLMTSRAAVAKAIGLGADELPHDHTFVLSRSNAMLLSYALAAWSAGVKFQLNAAREMLEPLFGILEKLKTSGTSQVFAESLHNWYFDELARANVAGAVARAERVEEQYQMLSAAAQRAKPAQIAKLLRDMIEVNGSGVLLSTVHKVKGLEAPRVFLLRMSFARYQERDQTKYPVTDEDKHIEYVAITRSQNEMYWVS